MPETNSSSSHSLVINTGPERYAGMIGKTLEINAFGDLGNNQIVIDLVSKIRYALGLATYGYEDFPKYLQRVKRLKDLVEQEFKGKVVLGFLEHYVEDLIKDDVYYALDYVPSVDHQSIHLYNEVWESDETLKSFLFNPKSEVYLDMDSHEITDIRRNSDPNTFDITLIYPVGGEIGNVEIPIPGSTFDRSTFDHRITRAWLLEEMYNVFNSVMFTKEGLAVPVRSQDAPGFRYNCFNHGDNFYIATWIWDMDKIQVQPMIKSKEFGIL